MIETLKPGETVTNINPGGGGYGNPFERPVEKIVWDVKNGLVSINGAREDYGVVIKDPQTLDGRHGGNREVARRAALAARPINVSA